MTRRKAGARRAPRQFTEEFKQEAVRLVQERRAAGVSLEQIARELDVGPDLLRAWGKERAPVEATGATLSSEPQDLQRELERLRRENEVLRKELDFLTKAAAFFAKESQ